MNVLEIMGLAFIITLSLIIFVSFTAAIVTAITRRSEIKKLEKLVIVENQLKKIKEEETKDAFNNKELNKNK